MLPFPLTVESYPGGFIVSDDVVNEWGTGATVEEATADYAICLASYIETLQRNSDRLAPRLQGHLLAVKAAGCTRINLAG